MVSSCSVEETNNLDTSNYCITIFFVNRLFAFFYHQQQLFIVKRSKSWCNFSLLALRLRSKSKILLPFSLLQRFFFFSFEMLRKLLSERNFFSSAIFFFSIFPEKESWKSCEVLLFLHNFSFVNGSF